MYFDIFMMTVFGCAVMALVEWLALQALAGHDMPEMASRTR